MIAELKTHILRFIFVVKNVSQKHVQNEKYRFIVTRCTHCSSQVVYQFLFSFSDDIHFKLFFSDKLCPIDCPLKNPLEEHNIHKPSSRRSCAQVKIPGILLHTFDDG